MREFEDKYLKQDLEDFIKGAEDILTSEYHDLKYEKKYLAFHKEFISSKWKNATRLIERLEKEFDSYETEYPQIMGENG